MKNLIYILLAVALLSGCSKDDDDREIDKLNAPFIGSWYSQTTSIVGEYYVFTSDFRFSHSAIYDKGTSKEELKEIESGYYELTETEIIFPSNTCDY